MAATLAARCAGDERDLAVYPSGHSTSTRVLPLLGDCPTLKLTPCLAADAPPGQGPDDSNEIIWP
jgi:hypothetical protein